MRWMDGRGAGLLALAAGLALLGLSPAAPAEAQGRTREQVHPSLAYMTNPEARSRSEQIDAFFMVWAEDRGGGSDIYGKRLFNNGLPQGGAEKQGVQVVRPSSRGDTPGERAAPDIVYNAAQQELYLVYSEFTDAQDGWDIYGVRVSTAGYSRTNPRLLVGGPGDQQNPDIALVSDDRSSNSGEYILVWDDNSRDLDEIWGLRVRGNGIPKNDPFLVFQPESWNASDPTTSGTVVAWVDDRGNEGGGGDEIYAIRLRNGIPNGEDYRLAGTNDDDFNPNFGAGSLVWNTYDPATGTDIVGARVYANAMTRGPNIGIVVPNADQSWPVMVNDLVVFSDNRAGNFDLYAIRTVNVRSRGREFPTLVDRP